MADHPSIQSAERSLRTLNREFKESHRIIGRITTEGREYRVIPASDSLPEGWDEAEDPKSEEEQIQDDIDKMIDEIFPTGLL